MALDILKALSRLLWGGGRGPLKLELAWKLEGWRVGNSAYVALFPVLRLCKGGKCVSQLGWGDMVKCETEGCRRFASGWFGRGREALMGSPPGVGESRAGFPEAERLARNIADVHPCFGLALINFGRELEMVREILSQEPGIKYLGWKLYIADGGLVMARQGHVGRHPTLHYAFLLCTRPECNPLGCIEWLELLYRLPDMRLAEWGWPPEPLLRVAKMMASNPDLQELARQNPGVLHEMLVTPMEGPDMQGRRPPEKAVQ